MILYDSLSLILSGIGPRSGPVPHLHKRSDG